MYVYIYINMFIFCILFILCWIKNETVVVGFTFSTYLKVTLLWCRFQLNSRRIAIDEAIAIIHCLLYRFLCAMIARTKNEKHIHTSGSKANYWKSPFGHLAKWIYLFSMAVSHSYLSCQRAPFLTPVQTASLSPLFFLVSSVEKTNPWTAQQCYNSCNIQELLKS